MRERAVSEAFLAENDTFPCQEVELKRPGNFVLGPSEGHHLRKRAQL